jgi:hypothetical protein
VTLVGVALLPNDVVQEDLINFVDKYPTEIKSLGLGLSNNLPHVSLHQFPVTDIQDFLRDFRPRIEKLVLGASNMSKVEYQPEGWLFASVECRAWMLSAQEELVFAADTLVARRQLKPASERKGYSSEESASYERHGYRYIGRSFHPHFTLGRTSSRKLDLSDACKNEYDQIFKNRAIVFPRLVIYEGGRFGSLARVLREISSS